MFFTEFRKIVQDYYRVFNISPFPSQKKYKKLRRDYMAWLSPVDDPDDISVAKYLDTREDLMSNTCDFDATPTVKVSPFPPMKLGYCESWSQCVECVPAPAKAEHPWKKGGKFNALLQDCKKQEGDNPMTINTERTYLNNRINDVRYIKRDDLAKQFRIYNSETPGTYKELIDAITNKQYTLDTKKTAKVDAQVAEGFGFGGPFYGIKFNLPTAPDFDGYNAAEKALNAADKAAKDVVNTLDAAAGLKALQDFELWSYTAPVAPTA